MLRKSRLYFSAILAALVVVSLLTTSNVKACEEEPQTFLSLYMNSDLVVFAKYDSETEPKKATEDEYGYSLETERKLVFTKIFKGNKDLKSISFAYSQYVPKPDPNQTNPDAEQEEIPEYDHFDVSKIKIGGEYLFFLTGNKETGEYSVTDYMSGVRELDKKISFYEKNLSDLEQIASAKENQYELLTEWIVKSIENPESREDALGDLAESFYGLSYQDEDPVFKGKGPFVVNEGYGTYTVGVAKHLTAAQKERVSAVLYPMLQEAWFAETPEYANYNISAILGGINKSRLAVYAYNSMRSLGKGDTERRRVIGNFLYEMSGDEVLSNLNNEVIELETKIGEAKNVKTPQGRKQLKDLNLLRDAKLKGLDARFNLLLDRNFVPVENTAS